MARTKNVEKHIVLTLGTKAVAVGLSYMLVPMVVGYLDVERYGIWVTMLSVMSWTVFLDVGLGNGLRNELAKALAAEDRRLAKTYVSTTYAIIVILIALTLLVLLGTAQFVPWSRVFNTAGATNAELLAIVLVLVGASLLNLTLSLCQQVFYACQEAGFAALPQLLTNALAVVAVFLLLRHTSGSLLYLSASYGLAMLLSGAAMTGFLYLRHPDIFPSLHHIDLRKAKAIASLGAKFFVIQAAALVIFATDNMIITQVLGPAHVATYNIVFKLFSAITLAHAMLLTPLWSAFTDAYARGDIQWIRRTMRRLNVLMIPMAIAVAFLVLATRGIVGIWVGRGITIPHLLPFFMGTYAVVYVWNNVYATFVNGLGRIRPQLFTAIMAGLINVPVSLLFAKHLAMGSSGVILGSVVSLSLFAIVGPIHAHRIMGELGARRDGAELESKGERNP